MKKLALLFMMAFGTLTLITFTAPNANACLRCEQDNNNRWYCGVYGTGVEICVIQSTACHEYYTCDDCQGGAGTHCSCGPTGCPAKLNEPELGKARLQACSANVGKNASLKLAGLSDREKFKRFMALLESGKLDGKVYLSSRSTLVPSIMNGHWKRFSIGFEQDLKGKMRTSYDLETPSGKKVHIVLVD